MYVYVNTYSYAFSEIVTFCMMNSVANWKITFILKKKTRTKSVKNSQGKTSYSLVEKDAMHQQQQQRTLFCQKHHKTYDVTDEYNINDPLIQNHTAEFQKNKPSYYRQLNHGIDRSSKVNNLYEFEWLCFQVLTIKYTTSY